jgi:threonine dehydratase
MSVSVETRTRAESVSEVFERIAPYILETPLDAYGWHGLNGNELFVKDEGRQHARTFKSRGAVALMHALRETGVTRTVTASAGNAGAGYAYAARRLGMHVDVVVPYGTPISKLENIKRMGGSAVSILESGLIVDESVSTAQEMADESDLVYAPPFNHPILAAGQGTMTAEALRQLPVADRLFVPVGGGSALAGALLATAEAQSRAKVVAVQFSDNRSMEQSVRAGELVTLDSVDTLCEGSSVRSTGRHILDIVMNNLEQLEFMTVSTEQVGRALSQEDRWRQELQPIYGQAAHMDFPETTGILAVAGAQVYAEGHPNLRGEKWIAMMTGANSDPGKVDEAIDTYHRSLARNYGARTNVVR